MTISRSISAALACALALGAACDIADDRMEWKVCSNGNLCPLDTACSEDGLRCLSCGNGIPEPGEACDDGNMRDGDGCDHNCTPTACGNGIITAGEACDDGNTRDGDECGSDCLKVCPAKRCYDRPTEAVQRVPAAPPDPCEGDPDC
jgi:cysteine-rich repeat protein